MKIYRKIKRRRLAKKKIVEEEAEWPFASINHVLPSPSEREIWNRISSINHALRMERFLRCLGLITDILGFIMNKISPYLQLFLYLVYILLVIYFHLTGSS